MLTNKMFLLFFSQYAYFVTALGRLFGWIASRCFWGVGVISLQACWTRPQELILIQVDCDGGYKVGT